MELRTYITRLFLYRSTDGTSDTQCMSAKATAYVWDFSPFNGSTLLVHLALADVANDAHENELWMSLGSISKKARVSRSTASVAMRELCDRGYLALLESGAKHRKPSRYWFCTSPESEQMPVTSPESGLDMPGERSSTSPESGRVTKENTTNSSAAKSVSQLPKTKPPWLETGETRSEWMRRTG